MFSHILLASVSLAACNGGIILISIIICSYRLVNNYVLYPCLASVVVLDIFFVMSLEDHCIVVSVLIIIEG